jgi:hypothetical protein
MQVRYQAALRPVNQRIAIMGDLPPIVKDKLALRDGNRARPSPVISMG